MQNPSGTSRWPGTPVSCVADRSCRFLRAVRTSVVCAQAPPAAVCHVAGRLVATVALVVGVAHHLAVAVLALDARRERGLARAAPFLAALGSGFPAFGLALDVEDGQLRRRWGKRGRLPLRRFLLPLRLVLLGEFPLLRRLLRLGCVAVERTLRRHVGRLWRSHVPGEVGEDLRQARG